MLELWEIAARPEQLPPPQQQAWRTWMFVGGRGAGKTRAGAEWVRGLAFGYPGFAARPVGRIALVAQTWADAREVMIEGISGVLAIHPHHVRPVFQRSSQGLCKGFCSQWDTTPADCQHV